MGHSLVDDDPVVFQVECDAPLLEGVRPEHEGAAVLISRRRKGYSETLRVGMDALLANARVIFDAVGPERSGPVGLESSQDQLPRLESGDLNQNSDSRSWSHPDPVVGEVTADSH